MRNEISGCVNCGQHCLGVRCPNHTNTEIYCDKCKDELSADEGFSYNGGEYCKSCLHDVLIADGVIGELNA